MNKKREFEKIYSENVDKIYRFLFLKTSEKSVAEDLTQKVFQKLWEKIKEGEKIENEKAFLYKIAQNLVVDFWRKEKKVQILPLEEKIIGDKTHNPYSLAEIQYEFERILKKLQELDDLEQNVLIWYYIEEIPVKEIAKILEKSEGAVRVLIHRSLQKLRKKFQVS